MWKDRIVEQVRKNREKIFAEFDYDIKKYSKYIMSMQQKEKERLVSITFVREKSL
ncbi:MAG: hypothetical protein HZB41_03925 [Ignavibacteriae bacterium]|nr:hypothetical protein [Ignavibacteriota bacterium]